MRRQSLSELMKGAGGFPDVMGIVDVILRAANGDIVQHEHKHNLVTEQIRAYWVETQTAMASMYVFINENTEAMHIKKTALRTVMSGTWAQFIDPSRDGPNRIWTYATVFSAPPSTRTFKTVGICRSRDTAGFTNIWGGPHTICAATVLSAPITQTTSQTLEVNYRLAFQRN